MEQACAHERAQPLSVRGHLRASTARSLGPAHQARLPDPAQEQAADLRPVLQPRRCGAGRLPALSGQRAARGLRPSRHADPVDAAGKEESICEAKAPDVKLFLPFTRSPPFVPAKAGTQRDKLKNGSQWPWVPACAGTNGENASSNGHSVK